MIFDSVWHGSLPFIMREIFESYVKKMMFFKRSQYRSRSILESFLDAWDQFVKILSSKNDLSEKLKKLRNSAQKRQENEKNELLKTKFSQPTLKNYKRPSRSSSFQIMPSLPIHSDDY